MVPKDDLPTDGHPDDATAATVIDTPKNRRSPEVPVQTEIPARLGHFQLLELLGHGGMGAVYSAYDLRLDRKVAIKVLADDIASSEGSRPYKQRLLREAQAMAKLSHPNVVPVYEVGVEDDTVFIAMEYVAGETLGHWLQSESRSWREKVDVFARAGRGLAAAHDVGIVHRDFKPSNVLVDDRGDARVVDFGIAHVGGVADHEEATGPRPRVELESEDELSPPALSTPLTKQGSLVGTPAYMSPEQFEGGAVDSRSDQFSFCVAMYEALYDKRPFEGRGDKLAKNVTGGAVIKPESKSVPNRITAVVLRGLSADPDQRFASMTELVAELERDPGRRQRRAFAAIAGAAVIATGATLAGWALKARSDDGVCGGAQSRMAGVWDDDVRSALASSFSATNLPYAQNSIAQVGSLLDAYRDDWVDMRTQTCRATRVRGEQSEQMLDLRMACLDHRLGEMRALTTVFAGPVDATVVEHAIDAAAALTPLSGCADMAALLSRGAEPSDPTAREKRVELVSRLEKLNADKRVNRYQEALEPSAALVADARAARDSRMLAEALALRGSLELHSGDLESAQVTLAEAARRAMQLADIDLFVAASIDLVSTLAEVGITKAREALGVIRLIETIVEDTHDPTLPIRLAEEKASEYMVLAHPDTALPILKDALARARRDLGDDDVVVFRLQSLKGSALGLLGKHAEAAAEHEALIAGATRVLGAVHPTTLRARVASCRVVADGGDLDGGAACFAEVLPDAVKVIGKHNREVVSFRAYHAFTLRRAGRNAEARDVYAATIEDIPESAWSEKWFVAIDVARELGQIEVETGDHQAGLTHCRQAAATMEGNHGPTVATCIGEALLGLDKAADALAVLEPVAADIEGVDPRQLGVSPSQIGQWRFAYARAIWEARRDAPKARALATRARNELSAATARDALDAWLSQLPRR